MRAIQAGFLVGALVACLAAVLSISSATVQAQRPASDPVGTAETEALVAIPGPDSDGHQSLLVLDRGLQTMASYQIDKQSGQITLRCVRSIRGDLQMDDFNGTEPSPEKIQALLQAR